VKRLSIDIPKASLPYEHLRSNGFVGAKIIGSGIVNRFLNAYYGFEAWDDWHDPNYLDTLLISPTKRPKHPILKKSMQESLSNPEQRSESQPQVAPGLSTKADSITDLDRKTLEHLQRRSKMDRSHLVLHYLYFKNKDSANKAADRLRSSQFVVEARLVSDEREWQVLAKHQIVLTADAIAAARRQMQQIADENLGEYDGWEAKVEPDK
jgi:regulator of RNase E activity RraB